MSTPSVAVVVPTRDRPDALARCLTALADQHLPPSEVVVVDDRSRDRAAVAHLVERCTLEVALVAGDGIGPAAARNRGAAATRSEVVCFTDDDCRPRPGWTSALVGGLGTDGAAAGATLVGDPRRRLDAAAQVVTTHLTLASVEPDSATVGFAPTCNLAVRREVLDEVPFDEAFPLAAGEDREWCDRLHEHGHRLRWVPDAEVAHHPGLDLRAFLRQQARYGRGGQRLRALRPSAGRLQPPSFYLDLLRAGAAEGLAVGALVGVAQGATAVGVVQEVVARRRAPGG